MKETIKILAMIASFMTIILIFMALETQAEAEPMPEPVYITLKQPKLRQMPPLKASAPGTA